ncbi:MAG TPA: SxtJ family membrane protein [Steroidobacteraceae bacterium]
MQVSAKLPSNRRFGVAFSAIFLALAAYATLEGRDAALSLTLIGMGAAFCVITLSRPRLLAPLNILWFRFGELLGRIVSPLALGIIYFALLTPIALIARLLGRDELRLKRRAVTSYWISRTPSRPSGQSFTRQF